MGKRKIGAAVLSWILALSMVLAQGTAVFAAEIPEDEVSIETSGEMTTDEEDTAAADVMLTDEADGELTEQADNGQLMDIPSDEEELSLPDEAGQAMFSGDDLSIEGDGSVGEMLADKLGAKLAEQEQNNGCFIRSLSVSGSTATVGFETVKDCTVIVGVYTEDGDKLLGSGSKEVCKVDTSVSVPITISSMPQYFYVKAFLVDTYAQSPLCKAYGSPEYTQDMQQLRKSTIYDYDSSRVLNLDYNANTNFLVYDEGVKQVLVGEEKNRIEKLGANQYRITDADSTVTGLRNGNIVSLTKTNGELTIVKVKSVSVAGTTVNITGDPVAIEQAFDYVKIESTGGMDQTTVDNSGCDPGVTAENKGNTMTNSGGVDEAEEGVLSSDGGEELITSADAEISSPSGIDINVDTTKSVSYTIDKKFGNEANNVTLAGVVDFASAVKAKVEITPQNQYMEVNVEYTAGIRLKASGHCQATLKLGKFMIMPVPGVFIEFTPSLIAELSGAIEINGTMTGGYGITVDGKTGISNTSKSPEFNAEIKGEVTVFVGFSMEPEVAVLCDEFANVGLTAKAGVEATASMTTAQNKDHLCGPQCIAGEMYGRLSLSASASLLNSKNLTWEYTMVDVKIKISDFYYSIKFGDFGWSKCPHLKEDKEYEQMSKMDDTDGKEFEFYTGLWSDLDPQGTNRTEVRKYNGNATSIKIPASYTTTDSDGNSRTYKVVRIDRNAFSSANIKSIYVPNSVDRIQGFAFAGLPNLTSVRLPGYLSQMGIGVFENCKKLKNIHIPSGITSLGEEDGYGMFSGCSSLENVELTGELQAIGNYTFYNCSSLKKIDLPYSIYRIGQGAFCGCTALTDITLPARDVKMGPLLFYRDTALKSIDISHQSEIPERCFDGCKALKSVKFSSKLTELGKEAFNDCSSINNVVLPESLRVIGDRAFWNCSKLKKIYIPKGIEKCIGHEGVFSGAGRVLHIYFGGSKKQFESVMGKVDTYRKDGIEVHFNAKPKDVSKSAASSADSDEEIYDEEVTEAASGSMSHKFTGLKKNTLYNVYYVKSGKAYDFYSADNLLFIDQYVSDAGGNLSISFTPRESVKGAEYVIREFKSVADDGKDDPDNPVTGIKLNKKEAYVKPGKTLQLKATITPSGASNKTVTWSSSKNSVATVSSDGKVKAKAAGTATITATTSNGKTATCKIKVPGIKLNDTVLYIQKGKTSTAITATCTNDSVKSVNSNKKGVATASKNGKKIKIKGLKPGKATITIKTKRGLTKKLTVNVQKDKVVTRKLTVSKNKITLNATGKNKKAVITVKATPNALSTGQKIKATPSKKNIVKASYNAKTGKLTITAKKKGKCKVKVSAGKQKKTINVTVKK